MGIFERLHTTNRMDTVMEAIRLLAAAYVIRTGIIVPLMVVLPVFIHSDMDVILLCLLVFMGEVWVISMLNAAGGYMRKATAINCWWEGLGGVRRR